MNDTSPRIRWEPYGPSACLLGYVGSREDWLFQIFPANDDADDRTFILMAQLPGALGDDRRSEDMEWLKAEAEHWLEEFTASLGAVWPEQCAGRSENEGGTAVQVQPRCMTPGTSAPVAGED